MIRDLSNEEQFEKSQSRTGHADSNDNIKDIDSTEDKSAGVGEILDVADGKNELKDEGMNERSDSES